jgi:hypothetical protein
VIFRLCVRMCSLKAFDVTSAESANRKEEFDFCVIIDDKKCKAIALQAGRGANFDTRATVEVS